MNYSDYTIQPIPLNRVKIKDKFWAPKIETNHNATIPHVFKKCEKTGRIDNFSRAAGLLNDGKEPIYCCDGCRDAAERVEQRVGAVIKPSKNNGSEFKNNKLNDVLGFNSSID